MKKLCLTLSSAVVGLALFQSSLHAAPKAKRGKLPQNATIVVYDRSPNSFMGTVLEDRYVSSRHDPVKVVFAGTEKLKLSETFTIEAVLHSADVGKYVWKGGKYTDKPIRMFKEQPLINRGEQWGLCIINNKITFYATLDGAKQQVQYDVPANWHRPLTTHRISGTYDGKAMKIYFDGKLAATQKASGKISNNPQAVYAGGRPDKPAISANLVQLDDVRVYNKSFDATEIANPLRRNEKSAVLSADIIQTEKIIFEQ